VLRNVRPGAIVLMHLGSNPDDHSTLDADALPRVIDGLRAMDYSFVTVAQFVLSLPRASIEGRTHRRGGAGSKGSW
jgi:peptidoglycan/xylan/chitin deacetylase (PgdA/CDA1 family)